MLPTGVLSFSLLSLTSLVTAGTVSYNWDITWVNANPDGQFARPVIGIGGQWPCPKIEATVGDTVQVTINNKLGNETTGLHFHGINQIDTDAMDGPSGVTQCPVPPGSSMTYKFVVCLPTPKGLPWQETSLLTRLLRLMSPARIGITATTWASIRTAFLDP